MNSKIVTIGHINFILQDKIVLPKTSTRVKGYCKGSAPEIVPAYKQHLYNYNFYNAQQCDASGKILPFSDTIIAEYNGYYGFGNFVESAALALEGNMFAAHREQFIGIMSRQHGNVK